MCVLLLLYFISSSSSSSSMFFFFCFSFFLQTIYCAESLGFTLARFQSKSKNAWRKHFVCVCERCTRLCMCRSISHKAFTLSLDVCVFCEEITGDRLDTMTNATAQKKRVTWFFVSVWKRKQLLCWHLFHSTQFSSNSPGWLTECSNLRSQFFFRLFPMWILRVNIWFCSCVRL